MGTLTTAGAALGIATVLSLAVWKLARTMFTPGRIVLFAAAAVLGWMVLLRAWALPYSDPNEIIRRLTAIGVGAAWFVLVRDAVLSVRDRD